MVLTKFFKENNKVALAFSGGVDSAYLLYEANKQAEHLRVFFVKTAFQPQRELDHATLVAKKLGAKLEILELDVLSDAVICSNDKNRCYYCKKNIFKNIKKHVDGDYVLIDGTNGSDNAEDRPGMRALAELSVRSPLREYGITKETIRSLAREANLFVWRKPSYSCLATRIETGIKITQPLLEKTEQAEEFIRSLGFVDFRVRTINGGAKIQIKQNQFKLFFTKRDLIAKELKKYYESVMLDLDGRK